MTSVHHVLMITDIAEAEGTTKPVIEEASQSEKQVSATDSHQNTHSSVTESDPAGHPHPVFLLLIVLVVIFLLVVMASVLVIVRIWFYRRKKSKPQKHWIIQQNMLHTKAQMSHLLTDEPYESVAACHQSSKSNIATAFDVP